MKYFQIATLFLCLYCNASAESPRKIKSKAATEVLQNHDSEVSSLDDAYKFKMKELDDAYVQRLLALRKHAAKQLEAIQKSVAAEDLDDAVKIRDAAVVLSSRSSLAPSHRLAKDESPKAPSSSFSKEKAELEKRVKNLADAFAPVALNKEMLSSVAGATYLVKLESGRVRTWYFGNDGRLVLDGRSAGYWTAIGGSDVVCVSEGDRNVNLFRFHNDRTQCTVDYLGNASNPKHHQTGVRQLP